MKTLLKDFLVFLLVGNRCESFSILSGRHIGYHTHGRLLWSQGRKRLSRKNGILSLKAHSIDNDSINSEERNEEDRIKCTLNNVGSRVTHNKGIKEINLELVSLGQRFDSFRRRFDHFSLLMGKEDEERNSNSEDHLQKSIWIRDNDLNANVESFLEAGRGLSPQKAKLEAENLHMQSYLLQPCMKSRTYSSSTNEEKKKTLIQNVGINFQVTTHDGIPTINDDDELYQKYHRRVSWEGDKYVTELIDNDETKCNVYVRVEKYLSFPDGDDTTRDKILMTVNSTLYNLEEIKDGENTLSCQEFFYPAYAIVKKDSNVNDRRYLSSEISRVPGCVSNVNVFTTLIPMVEEDNANQPMTGTTQLFYVMLDGEADTLLSRGLLSVLSSALSSLDSNDVLKIDSFTIADELKLRSVLSKGRNDGLSNMVSVVQNQIIEIVEKMQSTQLDTHLDNDTADELKGDDYLISKSSDRPTVAMLLSGGVDSAVALNLLKRQNYDVTAFYLKIWLEDELAHLGQCPWEDDFNMCVEICEHAGGIPLEAISLQDAYKDRVISYTIGEAKKGRTPNPDIMCNSRIKFGCFYDAIADRGFDYVASGHYAQLVKVHKGEEEVMQLHRAPDPVKDQSYFLAALRQDQLKRVLFPIGHLQKSKVRELAQEFDLPNKLRPDSQGLCFLGKVKFDEFLSAYLGQEPGDIIDADTGETIGRHKGIWYHTVGQRKGIGKVLDPKATSKGPWYVVAKDPNNRKIIASNKYDEDVFQETRSEFCVEDIKWISGYEPVHLKSSDNQMNFTMKIRHGPTIVSGILFLDSAGTGTVKLEGKDGGLAPGQFVVFYDDVECLGSGVISEKHWLKFQTQSIDADNKNLSIES